MRDSRRSTAAASLLALTALLAVALAGCAGAGAAPSPTIEPSARPTPTPIAPAVTTPAEAAAVVIASDPRFEGAIELTPDIIGASRWWVATPLESGGYRIELTIGWGDCPAGCIDRHTWTFHVSADGQLTPIGEQGDPVPNPLPE